jgi:GTP diphosphokinase / guanosine-3',5'-bis(diphosphate) 3'-diphosphatase
LFQEEIFVFTPTSEFKKLPKDSTPLDFAYSIHTEIGDHCIGAKVNSHVVPLDYKLQSGDQIEILTSKNQKPVKEWLNCVVTHRAKTYIQKYLAEENKQVQKDGERIFDDIKTKMNIEISDKEIDNIANFLKFKDRDSFFYALGSRNIDYSHLIQYFDQNLSPEQKMKLKYSANQLGNVSFNSIANYNALNSNLREKLSNFKFATCCLPLPGEEIAGRINDQDELEIHRANCKEIQDLLFSNQPSVFRLDWSAISNKHFTTKIHLSGDISPTIINDINNLVTSLEDTQIRSIHFETSHSDFDGIITIDVKNLEHLTKIFNKLQSIKGVKTVERYLE